MTAFLFGLLASALYLAGAAYQGLALARKLTLPKHRVQWLGVTAVLLHGIALVDLLKAPNGLNLGFFDAASLINWVIAALLLLTSLRKPVMNLAAGLFPLAALSLLCALFIGEQPNPLQNLTPGILTHILASVLAYSLFTLAAFQSALLAAQNYQLKHKHTRGIIQVLPPLQTMESVLFELLWVGLAFLTLSIVSGALFLDDLFAQHLAHKTVLSLVAWVVFSILLWGHHQLGWRGVTAVRWTLGGSVLLVLAYFGSKFALEILLAGS